MEHALICPQCKAPLTAHRFARSATCAYCGTTVFLDESSVSAEGFREAYQYWNAPENYGVFSYLSQGGRHWVLEKLLAQGEASDIYSSKLARWPTELVLIKILRDNNDVPFLQREDITLQALIHSQARGAAHFSRLVPQPVVLGTVTGSAHHGRMVSILRYESGFKHTFVDVKRAYPDGIPARSVIWIWRRLLELFSFMHRSGFAHGAVLPEHLLVQQNDHGVRLVGYGRSGRLGEPLPGMRPGCERYYPLSGNSIHQLTTDLDVVMSGRCMVDLLNGDLETCELPGGVPTALAALVSKVARLDPRREPPGDPLAIHKKLAEISDQVYGAPVFNPIRMPD